MARLISSHIAPRATIKDQVAKFVRDAILEGRIQPGQKVNESRIARDLNVSRSPIREALHQLEEQGLIENVERRGMYVVLLSKDDVVKMVSLRVVLEAEALKLARARLTSQIEEKLARLAERIERAAPRSPYEASRLDLEFHRAIWQLAGNEYLERALNRLVAPLFAHFIVTLMREQKDTEVVIGSHQPLFDFVRGVSSVSAENAIVEHLGYWKDAIICSSLAMQERARGKCKDA